MTERMQGTMTETQQQHKRQRLILMGPARYRHIPDSSHGSAHAHVHAPTYTRKYGRARARKHSSPPPSPAPAHALAQSVCNMPGLEAAHTVLNTLHLSPLAALIGIDRYRAAFYSFISRQDQDFRNPCPTCPRKWVWVAATERFERFIQCENIGEWDMEHQMLSESRAAGHVITQPPSPQGMDGMALPMQLGKGIRSPDATDVYSPEVCARSYVEFSTATPQPTCIR